MALSQDELLRYSRHLTLPEVGKAGQLRLKDARVAMVGTGGLGSPAAMYLAAAGVGTLGLIDFDEVDLSNLQRQILHGTGAIGRAKTESARERLGDLNPHVRVEPFPMQLTSANALDILRGFDVVLDGSDNFPTRYLVNDACALLGIPNVYGSIFRFEGQASVFDASVGPCYRCLFRDPPPPGLVPSCAEAGVIGVLPGIIGSIQALETIKLLLGVGDSLVGRLLMFDALSFEFRELKVHKDPACPLCGEHPEITELIDYEAFCGVGAPPSTFDSLEISVSTLKDTLDRGEAVVILDVREPVEWDICRIDGSVLMPLRDLPGRLRELDPHTPIATLCHRGIRSLHALEVLRAAGFGTVSSVRGGIDAWAAEIDPSMPRY